MGLTFLSLMSAYWWTNYILNFKKLISLILKNPLERTPKVISNRNLFSRFQSWCWFWCADQCKRIKQSDWPWKFLEHRVFHYSWVGVMLPPSGKKWPNPYPSESLPTKFIRYYYLKLGIIVWELKMVIKIFNNKISQFSTGIFMPVVYIFIRTYNSWPWKFAAGRKNLVPH